MPYSDGTFPSGAGIVTINALPYKANSFTAQKQTRATISRNYAGAADGALVFPLPLTGSAELQFDSSTTPEPTTACENVTTGVLVANVAGSNIACFITSCTITKPKDAPWTASVTWQETDFGPANALAGVSDPTSVFVEKLTPTPATNVTLTVTASGGYPPYTYAWDGGQTTNVFTNSYTLFDAPVTCTITDSVGATNVVEVDIYIGLF